MADSTLFCDPDWRLDGIIASRAIRKLLGHGSLLRGEAEIAWALVEAMEA